MSDDFAMTYALEKAGKPALFCPECLAATLHPWTGKSLQEFTNRQMIITRVYSSAAPLGSGCGRSRRLRAHDNFTPAS